MTEIYSERKLQFDDWDEFGIHTVYSYSIQACHS